MEKLQAELDRLLAQLVDADDVKSRLESVVSVYPFNNYEYIISALLAARLLSWDDYLLLRDEYIARNLYLYIFEISAPRGFGELWAQGHLKELVPALVKPTKRIDPEYSGQYDFLLNRIRIEVKASRAVAFQTEAPLYVKALASDSVKNFDMNFQQIKPACCDVFVWVGVWRDTIKYWVLSSREVENNRYYSRGQHRGNVGEGQLHINRINLREFEQYLVLANGLETAIENAFARQNLPG